MSKLFFRLQKPTPGEELKFTVSNGACDGDDATKIARATAEETDDAEYSYCTLPAPQDESDYRTSTCTTLSSGMKIDGVGLFYDDRCNSADLSGCGARSIPACRLCFVDKEEWLIRFPNERVPDWEDCPCCVASTLGLECATDGGGGGTDEGVIIGVSVAIAGVIAIACCLSCAFGTTIVRFVSSNIASSSCARVRTPSVVGTCSTAATDALWLWCVLRMVQGLHLPSWSFSLVYLWVVALWRRWYSLAFCFANGSLGSRSLRGGDPFQWGKHFLFVAKRRVRRPLPHTQWNSTKENTT